LTKGRVIRLIRFLRVAEVVDLTAIRAIHEEMRKLGVMRGIIVASSRFSKSAQDFAETRPIDLVDKDQLQKLLSKVPVSSKPVAR
jgi:hypothetical protein